MDDDRNGRSPGSDADPPLRPVEGDVDGGEEGLAAEPDLSVRLNWDRDLRFRGQAGRWVTEIDGNSAFAASPMELLLQSVGSCAAVDMVEILRRGGEELRQLTVQVSGDRREDPPRRFTRLEFYFHVTGDVSEKAARRAARLSFETYCSCFHSLRPDIELEYGVRLHRA